MSFISHLSHYCPHHFRNEETREAKLTTQKKGMESFSSASLCGRPLLPQKRIALDWMEYFLSTIYILSIAEHCKPYYSGWWFFCVFFFSLPVNFNFPRECGRCRGVLLRSASGKDFLPSSRTAVSPWDPLSCRKPTGSNTCPNPSQCGPYYITDEGRDMNAQKRQPYVASLRSHFSSRVPCGVSGGCYSVCLPPWFLPLPNLANVPFLPQVFIQVYPLHWTLNCLQIPPLREPTSWHRKGTCFDSYGMHFCREKTINLYMLIQ